MARIYDDLPPGWREVRPVRPLAFSPVPDRSEHLMRLERDAAISLLTEAPVECANRALLTEPPHLPADAVLRCGTCWPCRVDKFLRDAGVRR